MRIVSLLSSATAILFAIGTGDDVLAISHECDYPREATHLPRATRSLIDSSRPSLDIDEQVKRRLELGEALYELDRELIRSLKPDLIVTQAQCDVCAIKYQDVLDFVAAEPGLKSAKVLALNPRTLMQIFEDVLLVGQAAGRLEAAIAFKNRLLYRYERTLKTANAEWPRTTARPRVAILEWTEPLMGAGNWTPELVEAA